MIRKYVLTGLLLACGPALAAWVDSGGQATASMKVKTNGEYLLELSQESVAMSLDAGPGTVITQGVARSKDGTAAVMMNVGFTPVAGYSLNNTQASDDYVGTVICRDSDRQCLAVKMVGNQVHGDWKTKCGIKEEFPTGACWTMGNYPGVSFDILQVNARRPEQAGMYQMGITAMHWEA